MKHKHADLIHAWADGAKIEQYKINLDEWHDVSSYPVWDERLHYRIKPMPKPDMYKYIDVRAVRDGICQWTTCLPDEANLGLVFDGETRKLKSAEVLK
jgi:hypothetical protein